MVSRYKKYGGWFRESSRHSLSAKGVKTGRKTASLGLGLSKIHLAKSSPENDKHILSLIEHRFKDVEEGIIKDVNADDRVSLTYGMMPPFRDWLGSDLDEDYMYNLSPDAQEQVNYLVEEMDNRLAKKGIVLYGDEGDGTVVWGEKSSHFGVRSDIREMKYNEKLTKKKAQKLAKEYGLSLDKVKQIAEEEIGAKDINFAKGNKIVTVDITKQFGDLLTKHGYGDDSNNEKDIRKAGMFDVLDALSGRDNRKFTVEQARIEAKRRGL